MSESEGNKEDAGSLKVLWRDNRPGIFAVIGYTAGGALFFYSFTTYMQKFLLNSAHMDVKTVSYVMTAALFIYMWLQPLFGALADRIGTKTCLIAFGIFASLGTIPLFRAIQSAGDQPIYALCLILISFMIVSLYTSIGGIIKADLFPPGVRALGVGFPYAIANGIFGGTAEYLALWLKSSGHESLFPGYVTVVCIIFLCTAIAVPSGAAWRVWRARRMSRT